MSLFGSIIDQSQEHYSFNDGPLIGSVTLRLKPHRLMPFRRESHIAKNHFVERTTSSNYSFVENGLTSSKTV